MAGEPHTSGTAFGMHLNRLNSLLRGTLTDVPLRPEPRGGGGKMALTFAAPGYAKIRTESFGDLCLFVGQVCDFTRDRRVVSLHVWKYRYMISGSTDPEAGLRWEYTRTTGDGCAELHCNHHIQGSAELPLGDGILAMNAVHTPTGYVAVEDVVRYCIVELGCAGRAEWETVLASSHKRFKKQRTVRASAVL